MCTCAYVFVHVGHVCAGVSTHEATGFSAEAKSPRTQLTSHVRATHSAHAEKQPQARFINTQNINI